MKLKLALITFFLPALLAGCAFNTGIDTLLSPPKLTAQQELIYNALKDYTGINISLEYPKTGKNLSAFIVDDIDGDSEDEAVVFYQNNNSKPEDISLRMNILDSSDSGWRSVYDHTADGNEVEQVEVLKLGDSDKINIIVGYSHLNRNEKSFSIYEYSNGSISTLLDSEPYSVLDTDDLNNDGVDEIFTACTKTASKEASAVVYLSDNNKYKSYSLTLEDSYTGYKNISYNKIYNDETLIFLDAETGNGTIVTEVMQMDNDSNFKKIFSPDIEKNETLRSSAYLSQDIDNDGKVEIPIPYYCDGFDENSVSPIYFTSWYEVYGGKLRHKYESLFSINDGYVFMIPEQWYGHITAKSETDENEITLYSVSDNENEQEIFTLKVALGTKNKKTSEDNNFRLIRSRGGRKFFIKINENNPYVKKPEEIMMKFRFEE